LTDIDGVREPRILAVVELDRAPLLADRSITGGAWARRYSDLVDAGCGRCSTPNSVSSAPHDVALVAVGGFGRAELCPQSDLDLALLHRGRPEIARIAEQIWYPIWDAGFKLGHAVGTVSELVALASDDLDAATSYLSLRPLAGDASLADELATRARERWQKAREATSARPRGARR